MGSLVALFIGAIAIAHYVYGVPMQDRTTGQLSTPENTLTIFLLIGGGGLLFVIMGAMLLRWASARR